MPRELNIRPVLNGFIVNVGCQTLVFSEPGQLIAEFAAWVNKPAEIEAKYEKMMVDRGLIPPPPPPECRTAQECVGQGVGAQDLNIRTPAVPYGGPVEARPLHR